MKKVQEISIGGHNFHLDDDAFERIEKYLIHFRAKLIENEPEITKSQEDEVINEIEARIAELLIAETGGGMRAVTLSMISRITSQLGMPDGSVETDNDKEQNTMYVNTNPETKKKLYRDIDDKLIGGVCSGIGEFLKLDAVIIRLVMIFAGLAGGAGIWVYLILWIIIPAAKTPAQKCEMKGILVTAENLRSFSTKLNK